MYKIYTKEWDALHRHICKLLLVMRLTTVILVITMLQVSAATLAQRVTLKKDKASLKSVFTEIRKQTGYLVLYRSALVNNAKPVSVDLKDVALADALVQILDGQELAFTIEDKSVIIKEKDKGFLQKVKETILSIDVTGKVVDEAGNPLPGATVSVKNGRNATLTDIHGNFVLRSVDDNAILVISSIGYESQEIKAIPDLESVHLKQAISKLDEVQIQAYGVTSQRLSTGNISSVKATDIEKQPVNNPLLALAGRVPGLFITQTSGYSGTAVQVAIQGQNSISYGNDPFYVIDGVPFTSKLLTNLNAVTSILGNSGRSYIGANDGGGSPFSFINPSDIESIEILKDADATAIYGSRAANGAILITTKKGKSGQTKVELTIQNGWGEVSRRLNLMNTSQYLQMRKDAFSNDGLAVPNLTSSPDNLNYDLTVYDPNKYTDWQKELIGGTAQYSDFQGAISGGQDLTNFRINGGYHRETTVFPGSLADLKGSLGVSLNHSSINRKFKIQFTSNYLVDNNHLMIKDLTQTALSLAPNAPALFNNDGSLNWQPLANGNSTWFNPLAYFNNQVNLKTKNLLANTVVSYNIIKNLDIKTSLGYTDLQSNVNSLAPLTAVAPENRSTGTRSANYSQGNTNSWIIEPQLSYLKRISSGTLNVLIGATFQQNNSNQQAITARGFSSDELLSDARSASSVSITNSVASVYKYNAIFGRLNYNWDDKYLINLTARRDGSSRFGPENQFHNFGAVGAGWIFSNEDFLKKNLPSLSFGKLRASYGTTGNDQIGDYQFISQYTAINGVSNAYQGASGLLQTGLTNQYLQWELTKKLQVGIDLGFFSDRVLLNVNYYINKSSNQLLSYALPILSGYGSILTNFPATVKNTGWEASLSTTNIKSKLFTWSSSLNFTVPKNVLESFPNLATSSYANSAVIGQPVNIRKLYSSAGVDPQTGLSQFYTANGNLTADPNGQTDQIILANTNPKFYGGFQNSITYGDLSLDFLFQFVKQSGPNLLSYGFNNLTGWFSGRGDYGNLPTYYSNYWRKQGDYTNIQQVSTGDNDLSSSFASSSNLAYSDASYIRLKNVSFSWKVPNKWGKAAHIQGCRLFVQGQNLLTITKYMGLDPENQTVQLPPLRVWTLGLQVTL